LLNRGGSFG